jgi:hypothetical protein
LPYIMSMRHDRRIHAFLSRQPGATADEQDEDNSKLDGNYNWHQVSLNSKRHAPRVFVLPADGLSIKRWSIHCSVIVCVCGRFLITIDLKVVTNGRYLHVDARTYFIGYEMGVSSKRRSKAWLD